MKSVLNIKNIDYTKQPLFFGEDLNLQRYDKFKYPIFFELFKKQEEFSWLTEVNSQSLQASLKNLENAYQKFFKKQAKFPRFKSKKLSTNSFHCPQNVEVIGNKLFIPKFKDGIKFPKFY